MAPSEARTQKLMDILAQETHKPLGTIKGRTPSIFRETWQDTHKTMAPEYFGSPRVAELQASRRAGGSLSAGTAHHHHGRSASTGRRGMSGAFGRSASFSGDNATGGSAPGNVEFRSVFKPRPEQEAVCALATERRARVANSEWALLDTFEVAMYMDEKEARHRRQLAQQASQRRHLDAQMKEAEAAKAREAAQQEYEKRITEQEIERYKHEEQERMEAKRATNMKLKAETQAVLDETRAAKARAAAAAKAEGLRQLEEAKRQMEAEKERQAAKQAKLKEQWQRDTMENDARIAARKAAAERQKAVDEALMAETIATLERQEREREEKIKAFHTLIAERANKVGQRALEENRERIEREERLIKQFETQKAAEYEAKERETARRKAQQKEETLQAKQEFQTLKAMRTAAAKAEVQALRAETVAAATAEAEAEARKMAAIRARAEANKEFLRTQMQTKDRERVCDDVNMTDRERDLNRRLLQQAVRTVGAPKQLTVKF